MPKLSLAQVFFLEMTFVGDFWINGHLKPFATTLFLLMELFNFSNNSFFIYGVN